MAPDPHAPIPEPPRSDPMARACALALVLWLIAMFAAALSPSPSRATSSALSTEGAAGVSSWGR